VGQARQKKKILRCRLPKSSFSAPLGRELGETPGRSEIFTGARIGKFPPCKLIFTTVVGLVKAVYEQSTSANNHKEKG
jgi:hypothetical protein